MRKILLICTIITFILFLAGGIIGGIFWSQVPDIVANKISNQLKVPVQIDEINLGWGKIHIKELEISNTPHSFLAKALTCKAIHLITPFKRYLEEKIVIDTIELNNVYLGLEFDSATTTKGNWTEIMSHLQSSSSKKTPKQAANSSHSILIHHLILTDLNVDVVYRKEGGQVHHLKTIPRIELNEISSEGGLPIDQIMNSVLGQMLKAVFEKENLKNMLQEFLQPQKGIQKYLEPFKGFFNTKTQHQEQDTLASSTRFLTNT